MRRKWLTALLVTSVVLVMAAPAWAQVPNPGTGNINIILQNIDGTQDAVIEVSYLGQDGTEVYSSNHSLAPYVSTEIRVADIQDTVPPILGDGWLGTAVVSSSTMGATVGSAYWTGGGEGDGKTAGAYIGFSSGSTTVYLPYIFHVSSRASVFSVQNISEDTTANITIHYLDRATGNEVATVTDSIVPKGQKTYDLIAQTPADKIPNPVKGDFEGAVYIESNVPIAAVSQTHWRFFSSIYNGLSAGDTTLYFPQVVRVRREDGTWVRWSTLLIQNITNSNVTVTVRIYDANGNEKVNFTDTVGPKCAAGYNTRFKGDIPDNVFTAGDQGLHRFSRHHVQRSQQHSGYIPHPVFQAQDGLHLQRLQASRRHQSPGLPRCLQHGRHQVDGDHRPEPGGHGCPRGRLFLHPGCR